jgi:hypothetical protein
MTNDEKKAALIAKVGEQRVNELTQYIWLLLGALNTAQFAIAQFEPRKMKFEMKNRFNNLNNAIKFFVNNFEKAITPNEKDILETNTFDNIGIVAELIAMTTTLPESQQEWYLNECKKLLFSAYNKSKNELRSESGE